MPAPESAPAPSEGLRPAPGDSPPRAGHPLAFSWARDVGTAAGAGALWLVSDTVFKSALAANACRWCEVPTGGGAPAPNALDAWGRSVMQARGAEKAAALLSDIAAFVVVPAAALGVEGGLAFSQGAGLEEAAEDAVIVAQAVAFAAVLNQGVKFTVGRARPYVHTLSLEERASDPKANDFYTSFYSGHSSLAFSAVVAAGTVAGLRGRPHQWVVWAVGLPLATAAPLLRMAADKHYLSDVLVGSAMGAAMGYLVPTLLHPRLATLPVPVSVGVSPGGVSVAGAF